LLLKGYFIHAKNDSAKATIIIIHGIGACKEQMLSFTAHLSEEGFNTMIFDLRAQGQSEGTFCTYGFYEKEDVSIIIDSLIRRNATQPFGIWGSSLGGAVALQSLAFDQRLKFGIIESTFDELDHVVLEYSNDLLHFKSKWMCCVSLDKAGKLAHFNPAEVKPVEACKQITQPVMIAHGLRDEKIPIEFDRRNFAALAGAEKEFVEVPGAGHLNLQTVGGDDYFEKMVSFINLHLQK
jgi:alpha-beta hydrolase superfamily lysophospholipase